MDSNTAGRDAELLYETTNTGIGSYNVKFSRYCWGSKDMEYCNQCMQCRDCFACVSLKPGARFCIFNTQYSESEYRDLVAKIKKQMRSSGEYGEFFTLSISLFGYNNSTSFDTLPLSQEKVLSKGWKWEDQESGTIGKGTVDMNDIPKSIHDAPDTFKKEVLTCTACKRNYNITQHELTFYKKENVPIPRSCPTCRHRHRLAIRAPRETFLRPCAQCKKEIRTTYSPKHPEVVYCDTCYLGMVY